MTESNFIPDFSGDDFANDKEIQKIRAASKAYEQMIEDSFAVIRKELSMEPSSHINFKDFHMFKSLGATITHSLKSVDNSKRVRVSLARYHSSFPVPRNDNSGDDQYLFGHISFTTQYPRTYIHKETIREKIEDLFLKRELDFSLSKKFSGKFQVLTENKNRLQTLFQVKNLDVLTDFPEMELELFNNAALFRCSRKPVSVEEATMFCNLANVLIKLLH